MDKKKFYDNLRKSKLLGPSLSPDELAGIEAILGKTENWSTSWISYALATAYHETAHTMKPIKELGGYKYLTRMYDISGNRPNLARANGNTVVGDGAKYCGRGFVQLTWKNNYAKAEKLLGIAGLTQDPDKAMILENAAKILSSGMELGWFSGKKLADYLSKPTATRAEFIAARKIINGTDKAELIADYAIEFQQDLTK